MKNHEELQEWCFGEVGEPVKLDENAVTLEGFPDRVIIDDPEDQAYELTAEERQSIERWLSEGLILPASQEVRTFSHPMPDEFLKHYRGQPLEDRRLDDNMEGK